jgi:8-oxo-dGTP diphosphatase
MPKNPSFPIGITIFVVRNGKLLLGKRRGSKTEDAWGLPGGYLKDGESMVEAAVRELKEQTSLTAKKCKFINLVNDNANAVHHAIQVGFLVDEITGEPKLMESDAYFEWKWFSLESLPEPIFLDHAKQIELFLNHLHFGDTSN